MGKNKSFTKKVITVLLSVLMVVTSIVPSLNLSSVYAEDIDVHDENILEEVIVPDIDYSSMRLVVDGEVESEAVIASLDGVSILQYETEEDTMLAYAELSESM